MVVIFVAEDNQDRNKHKKKHITYTIKIHSRVYITWVYRHCCNSNSPVYSKTITHYQRAKYRRLGACAVLSCCFQAFCTDSYRTVMCFSVLSAVHVILCICSRVFVQAYISSAHAHMDMCMCSSPTTCPLNLAVSLCSCACLIKMQYSCTSGNTAAKQDAIITAWQL